MEGERFGFRAVEGSPPSGGERRGAEEMERWVEVEEDLRDGAAMET